MKTLLLAPRPRTRQLLGEALKRHNHEVTLVDDAEAACAAFQPGGHRLVIVEVGPQHEDGVRLCRRLRALSPRGQCLILAASQAPGPEQVGELLAAGADDCLTELDDAQRLEVRLAVAEHRLDHPGDSASGQGEAGPFPLPADASYGAFRTTVDGKFLEVNPALVEMLGYDSAEELLAVDIGRDVFRDPACRQPLVSQVTEHGHLDGFEVAWKRKDGTPITILGSSRAVFDGCGKVVCLEGIVHNITPQKLAEEARRESEQRFQAVFDHAADGIAVVDVETKRFCLGNPAFCRMLGYSREEVGDLRVMDIHPEEDLPRSMEEFQRQVRREPKPAKDIPMKRKDGSIFFADISSFPITLAGKAYLAGSFRDVTDRHREETLVRESEKRLRTVLENMPVMLDAFDQDRNIVAWNRECERITGYRADEIVGNPQGLHWLYPDDAYRRRMLEEWRRRGNNLRDWEWEVTCKDGTTRTIAWSNVSEHFPVPGWATWGVGVDVTERKQAEQFLAEELHRRRLILETSMDGFFMADMEGRLHEVNPSYCAILGYARDELLSMSIQDVEALESPRDVSQHIREISQRGLHRFETKQRRKDGRLLDIEISAHAGRSSRGEFLFTFVRDITQRKQAERALRESEAKLHSLVKNLPDFVVLVDRQATIQFVNRGTPDAAPEELLGATGFGFLAPEHQPRCREVFGRTLAEHQPQRVEALDVFGHWWDCRLVPMIEEDQVRNVMVICTDVTQRRDATEALQKEQHLLRQLLDLHERDRQLTAYEIHDGFSQYLTGALYNLQGFRELHAKSPLEAWRTFDTGVSLIRRSINEARRLIGGLRPPILDESGIVAAIDYLACETAEHEEAEVEFVHDVKFQRLVPPLESAVFRIVQESLNNARRYSQSAKIRIELRQRDDHVCIGVRDWGIGFDPERTTEGRFGLQGIRERVRLFGGQVTIETALGKGTLVSVELPLIERAQEPSPPSNG